MAGVFLSYDRDDTDRARPIALALEKAGHSVWWDLHVRGGAQFGKVIEDALKAADAVVVLWSKHSVESAWVKDEAAAGRDSGRLVPITIDGTEPPLGFRQFQTIDLSRSRGSGKSPQLGLLLGAIEDLAPTSVEHAKCPEMVPRKPSERFSRKPVILGVIAAATIVGAAGTWWFTHRLPVVPLVMVAAAEPSAQSQALARDLFVKLGQLQAANPEALEITDNVGERRPDFTFKISVSPSMDNATVNMSLVGRDRALLWSKDLERPPKEYGDLRQQAALAAGRVLECASRAVSDGGKKLDERTLKLFLSGCAKLSDLAWTDFRGLVPVFREVTQRAPLFEDGWAKLVETEAYVIGWETLPRTAPERRRLSLDVARARKLDPQMAEAYFADSMLLERTDLAGTARLVDQALRDNPDHPLIQSMNAGFLSRVGRIKESVEASKRTYELNPLSGDAAGGYIVALAYAGQLDAALKELERAESFWPGSHSLVEARFRINLRYGDPKDALRIVRSGVNPNYAEFESFLLARIDPTEENIDRAVADAKAAVGQSPRGAGWLFLALAQFGREDEIYRMIESHPEMAFLQELFFRSIFSRFRHDVRFLKLANRAGLVDFWRSSGHWPDFCFEPDLPYDCKTEAAKLTTQ